MFGAVHSKISPATAALYGYQQTQWLSELIWLQSGSAHENLQFSKRGDGTTTNDPVSGDIKCVKEHGGMIVMTYDDSIDQLVPKCKCTARQVWQGPSCETPNPMYCNGGGANAIPVWENGQWQCKQQGSNSETPPETPVVLNMHNKQIFVYGDNKRQRLELLY
uniref:Uncharacterized protein U3 n=1 Tax=Hyposoter didymator TaxID=260305 RepID=D7P5M1_HYPDD|nr:unknown [Hyposoter didymator]